MKVNLRLSPVNHPVIDTIFLFPDALKNGGEEISHVVVVWIFVKLEVTNVPQVGFEFVCVMD
jgi:hypothetical protein